MILCTEKKIKNQDRGKKKTLNIDFLFLVCSFPFVWREGRLARRCSINWDKSGWCRKKIENFKFFSSNYFYILNLFSHTLKTKIEGGFKLKILPLHFMQNNKKFWTTCIWMHNPAWHSTIQCGGFIFLFSFTYIYFFEILLFFF